MATESAPHFNRLSPPTTLKSAARWLLRPETAVLVGIGFRIWFFLLNDSFWRDEAKLLWRVAQDNLVLETTFPVFWLYRLFYQAGWGSELPMRALSLFASILGLLVFFILARRVLKDARATAFATWLLALAPGVILFAGLTKPYSLDILIAAGLLYLAAKPLLEPTGDIKLLPLTLAAALAPWISYPSAFVVGGIGIGLLLQHRSLGFRPAARYLALVSLSIMLLMGTLSFFAWKSLPDRMAILSQVQSDNPVYQYWRWKLCQVFYAYLGPRVSYAFTDARSYPVNLFLVGLAGLMIGGLWESQKRHGWAWTAVLAGPLGLALLVAYLRLYSFFGRHLLFAVPGLFLLAGYGAAWLGRAVKRPILVGCLLVLLVIPCGQTTIKALARPVGGIREALKYINVHQLPGDLVFFDTYAAPTIRYYKLLAKPYAMNLRYGLQPEDWEEGKVKWSDLKLEDLLALIPADKRIWLVAETVDYARGPVVIVLPYWKKLEQGLAAQRKSIGSYTTDRVQVRGFSRQHNVSK